IFDQMASEKKPLSNISRLHSNVALRVLKHAVGNLFGKRKMIAPKDLWDIKGIVSWGADTSAFAPVVYEQWDQWMLQFYGSSEAGMVAIQDWRKDGMTFLPDSVFMEFLPENINGQSSNGHTLLIDQLEPGKRYEPVITNLYGMPFVRYRQGDLIEVVHDGASANGNTLPKVVFHNRADDLIDLFGIARLVTKTIEEALNQTGVTNGQWSVCKDHEGDRPILRLYIELPEESSHAKFAHRIHRKLMSVDRHYAEAVFVVGYNPVRVVPLGQGTFERYAKNNMNGRGDIDHYMPPRMNITDSIAAELMRFDA
ncbi:MAG: GH3 auxin-responsive promoter family protein, partial [Planctomycetes bacterium]|nr:GH3 auxin-responsive promoter family protein [Planctomycetota bacterium]